MMALITDVVSPFQLGLLSFPILILLIGMRVPLAAAMLVIGLGGNYLITGNVRMIDSHLKTFTYGVLTNYSLSIIPLFLLMAEFAKYGGMSFALFNTARIWFGHYKGGIAIAAIGASAGFGAVCGSSLATASSMGKVALPELRNAGYSPSLATGALAAGGTLGILIPPSIVLVIYAILAEENIQKLFIAAFVPGILAMLGYMIVITIYSHLVPEATTKLAHTDYRTRFRALFDIWHIAVIFGLIIGGIYTGAFSPTAAAAIGVAGTALVAISKKRLTLDKLKQALLTTVEISAMIFFIILAANIFNSFLSSANVPQILAAYFIAAELSPWMILASMLLLYVILGTVMDSLAMIFLTVPIFIPIISELDFGIPPEEVGIWFGILVLMSVEIGLITPPIGLNLFVINALAKDVSIIETYRGALPFVVSDLIRIAILAAFPIVTMGLVRLLY